MGEPEEVAEAALNLQRELLEIDVADVRLVRTAEAPLGAKGTDLVALGLLAVTLGKSGLLPAAVSVIRTWLGSHPKGNVRLELDGDVLELTAVSSQEQRRLSDEWLSRHGEH